MSDLITDEVLDAALAAGQTEYRRSFQLTHDPSVARLVDAAVESALEAAAPAIAAKALRDFDDRAMLPKQWSERALSDADRIERGEL